MTMRVNVQERLLEAMEPDKAYTLRQVTDAANADEGSFILGELAVQSCLRHMESKGLVCITKTHVPLHYIPTQKG